MHRDVIHMYNDVILQINVSLYEGPRLQQNRKYPNYEICLPYFCNHSNQGTLATKVTMVAKVLAGLTGTLVTMVTKITAVTLGIMVNWHWS